MWKEILEALCKSFAQDDPELVDAIYQAESGFQKWSQYFNPNDISGMEDGDKVLVSILSEELQDIRMRTEYSRYLHKKTNDERLQSTWLYLHQTLGEHFWAYSRIKYKLWNVGCIALRDGWKLVECPQRNEMPDIIRKIMGG